MMMMSGDLSLLMVFAAGLLSFFSPCVLPLIPSYFCVLTGMSLQANREKSRALPLFWAAGGFVLGFSAVFIVLGLLVNTVFFLMGDITVYIMRGAGILVVLLGLNILFDFFSFLNYENRPFLHKGIFGPRNHEPSPARGNGFRRGCAAFVAGMAFAAGWTPCVGPILTGILVMVAQSGKTGTAAFYLALYSLGFAAPFLLAALFFDSFVNHASRIRGRFPLIRRISGILLIIIGIMILTGRYSALNGMIQALVLRYIDWAETKVLPFRLLAGALAWLQNF